MKFKVKKGTKLFKELKELQKRMIFCNKEAFALAEKHGFSQIRCLDGYEALAGGITSFYADKKPEGFAWTYGSKAPNDFFPKKTNANKPLLKAIKELPYVKIDDLNKLIKYDGLKMRTNNHISFHPGISFRNKDYVLFDVSECTRYKPVEDMIEITVSEYKQLNSEK